MHICVSKLTIIVPDNGLSPDRRQSIIWTNAGILLIRTSGTNFSELLSEIHIFSFKKMHLKIPSAKWRPFCLGLNVLKQSCGYWSPWPQVITHCQVGTKPLSVRIQGPVSLRLLMSQFKDIVTHAQKMKTVKCIFCSVWVQNFVWNFKGALWNFTQNFEPIHRKICILRGVKNLTYDILELWHLKS